MLRRSGFVEEVRVLDPSEGLSPGQVEEIDRIYKMYPHLRDDKFMRRYIDMWVDCKCVGYETFRELGIEDTRKILGE